MNTAFVQKAREIAVEIGKRNDFLVVGNYDADGISSTGIMCTALNRLGKKFSTKILKQLYEEEIEKIAGTAQNYIFIDFGSGQLGLLKKIVKENFFVIDHHQPEKEEWPFHLNPLLFGVDGGSEISAAGTAYMVARELGDNRDLSALAVVGALGDMQEQSTGLSGHNREILEEGIGKGVLSKKNDLKLYGRISRPLVQFLQFSSNPIIPGLTANEKACSEFILGTGVDLKEGETWRNYESLSPEEKKRLATALILHMNKNNVPDWKIQAMFGEVYTLEKESRQSPLRDAKEFGTVMNACGRWGHSDIALSLCLGDRAEAYHVALGLLAEHRKQLREGIELMKERGVEEYKNFYFFDAGDRIKDSIIGIVAGMLYGSGAISENKPIIALTHNPDGSVKASGRATGELVRRGLNLGKAFKELQARWGEGTEGGGHAVAAGVKFPAEKKQEFLKELGEILGKQVS
ncbi:MAG: DHH family phosphoesterase [Candidatus Diapherotrites archaeon]|nr:DHH family phosphoesterase [Candidatus Diapherotrites archaeon]